MLCVVDIDTTNQAEAAELLIRLFELNMARAQREAKALPPLYKSGVRYVSQDPRACAYRTPQEVYDRKGGDCKQLVLWRMAECRNAGHHCTARIIWLNQAGKFVAHAQLRHPDGSIEDPSYNLGMTPVEGKKLQLPRNRQ